ncbi:MAG: hypothetical protein EOT04_02735 [Candidatus Chaera renei]|uniref:Uncharacterized protein n=1 Tax=Candidatus Chaera renei TaxID=2506947 RepID=A0A4Q0AG62_9BACT|nr:MAG: hypothetical protein EOT04_02735 [Candidatus Chaera renei]
MARIKEFVVVKPPTSGEVCEGAFKALKARGPLSLTVLGTQEVPRPEPEEIAFKVIQTSQLKEGGMRLVGRTATKDIVTVTTRADETLPATGDIIQ